MQSVLRSPAGFSPVALPLPGDRKPAARRPVRRPTVPLMRAAEADETVVLQVCDFMVPQHRRLAASVLQATLVRDVAAFGAVVLFGTMLALVLGG